MAQFSEHWRKYPVLYDDKARNSLFVNDWKSAAANLNEAYTKLASDTGLTVEEVKAKCTKYKDAITKAVGQFMDDVRSGSNTMPTPGAVKLIVFFWLLPFSSKYNPELLQHRTLDMYVEKILQARLNKMGRMHEDVTEITSALERVRHCIDVRSKPKAVRVFASPLTFADLPAIAAEHGVVFVPNLFPVPEFKDESSELHHLPAVEETVDIKRLPYMISDWLSRVCDKTFDWKVQGLQYQRFSVNETEAGLLSTNKQRAHAVAVALHKAANKSRDAWREIDAVHAVEDAHFSHVALGVGLSVINEAAGWLENLTPVKHSVKSWYVNKDCALNVQMFSNVLSVANAALSLEEARDNYMKAPARQVHPNSINYDALRNMREKGKVFSLSFWNL